ncbi:universal stress protein [Streptomyces caniscabiei]|uniref:Universal stress protein n=1 Tax=Streptomyces caniscabiei TaxID=2746961 RepID=A0A927QHP3_9ACTN|nr:universal stress protein [Streptomyces caniscabiei]MBD9727498.1 universal stress protein [Streptomyces caniscabiei]MDX3512612.1 universal stress protein [Streptomyces caniscabiei]MDX3722137.1 universal stress protein [Streptomyces caniscabiei]WEO28879.1 universal stress protein [Streptomyces caniscabiei]
MSRTVTVGLDGSLESRAAGEWAAREAKLRGLPLKIVHVWEPVPEPIAQAPLLGAETQQHWSERSEMGVPPAESWGRIPREAAEGLRLRHPGVDVTTEQIPGRPTDALAEAAKDAELLVLGSRGLSGIGGFLVGSVGAAVIARTETPVVLVRSGEQAAGEHEKDPTGVPPAATAYRPVVLGLDTDHPDDTVIAFAFEEAARRGAVLKVVHGWILPPYYVSSLPAAPEVGVELGRQDAAALAKVLSPWRQKYPDVEVVEESRLGTPAGHVIDASREASLVVVGRRIRRSPIGAHIGPVTHAVLHHATAPVAVVAHD